MSYYYDWVDRNWVPCNRTEPTPALRRQRARQRNLLNHLITEIEHGNGVAHLYASLLARALVTNDEALMQDFGKQVAYMTSEQVDQTFCKLHRSTPG
jgi:hypothetical protein